MIEAMSPPEMAARSCCSNAAASSTGGAISTMRQRFGGVAGIPELSVGSHAAGSWLDLGIDEGRSLEQGCALAESPLPRYCGIAKGLFMNALLTDPWFYAAAIPAVILVGLSKG